MLHDRPSDPHAGIAALRELALALDAFRSASADAMQLGVRETEAISYLRLRGSMSHLELASALRLTRGTVTALVDRLVAAGLVERRPHHGDRRVVLVSLTSDADAYLDPSHAALVATFAAVPGSDSAPAVAVLHDLAAALRDNTPD